MMIFVIYIWISVLIIQLAAVTPYSRLQIVPTTAEAWKCRFDPIFLQNVFFICIRKPQKFLGRVLGGFSPLKRFFSPTPWSGLSFSKIVDYPETQLKVSFPKLWITILQTPIGGHHPMLYFKSQTTEKYSIAICQGSRVLNFR